MKPYQYESRKGMKRISWKQFHQMCKELAAQVAEEGFDMVIGVARGGLYPATLISGMLRKEIYPVRITRRENDRIRWKKPVWRVDVSDIVRNRKVLIIDEIADTGETLSIVSRRVKDKGGKSVNTLALVTHSWANPRPGYSAIESDELIIFPWDKEILVDRKWRLHPELGGAINLQKTEDEVV